MLSGRGPHNYITVKIEELKYGTAIINEIPDFEAMKGRAQETSSAADTAESKRLTKWEREIIELSDQELKKRSRRWMEYSKAYRESCRRELQKRGL